MAKVNHQLQGVAGVIALVLALGVASIRFIGMSNVHDEALQSDLVMRLDSDSSGQWTKRLERAKRQGDYTQLAEEMRGASPSVSIHKVSLSTPLLEWSNKQKVIVRVEYATEDSATQVRYLRYYRNGFGNWEYRGVSSASSYYMNFL